MLHFFSQVDGVAIGASDCPGEPGSGRVVGAGPGSLNERTRDRMGKGPSLTPESRALRRAGEDGADTVKKTTRSVRKGIKNQKSKISIFFMSLFNWQDLLDNHQFFLFINIVKCSVTEGNVKPVNYNPAS